MLLDFENFLKIRFKKGSERKRLVATKNKRLKGPSSLLRRLTISEKRKLKCCDFHSNQAVFRIHF